MAIAEIRRSLKSALYTRVNISTYAVAKVETADPLTEAAFRVPFVLYQFFSRHTEDKEQAAGLSRCKSEVTTFSSNLLSLTDTPERISKHCRLLKNELIIKGN